MNRDEIILSCQDLVKNLVKKYHNPNFEDEDLESVGMIAVCECVNRCIEDELEDLGKIQARCNVWARNAILQEIYKEKVKYSDDNTAIDTTPSTESDVELDVYLEQALTDRQKEIVELELFGYSHDEICKRLKISSPTLYEHLRNIRKIINFKP